MPKLKTRKGAAKRFKKTKSGKFKRSKAFGGHLMTGKSAKRRRSLRTATTASPGDSKKLRVQLPYA